VASKTADLDIYLADIVAGNEVAFGHWMRGAQRLLRGSLQSFATSVDTEAVLQEALLRTWQIAPKVEPDGKPNTLLRVSLRITRNLAISEARKHKRVQYAPDRTLEKQLESQSDGPPPSPPDPMLRRALQDCEEKLPEKPKQVFKARIHSQGGEADLHLAQALSMRKNTFLQNFSRARKFLLECLRAAGVDLEQEWV
tara:strand:- start:10948 stop:11538 length:591 start_codon:yes stop_codon:yes gene_type:complete